MKKYIVIGAGVLGASTAYHLARAGEQVTVIDRKDPEQATDAAAGIVCPWLSQRRNKKWYSLVKNGAKYYPDLINQLEEDGETETGYQRVGAISLHTDERKLEQMVERAIKRREDAPEIGEVTRLSQSETKTMFPPLSEEYSSVHVSGAARVNGRALREALINASKRRGAVLIHEEASITVENNQVTGVQAGSEWMQADQVIVTAGAWAQELLQPLGVQFLVSSQKAQIAHLEMLKTNTSEWPVVMPPNNQYMLSFEEGRIVVGATHEDDAGRDGRVTAGGLHYILDKALAVAPGLQDSTLLETRVGFRPFTPGFLPVFGMVPGYKGLLAANGLGASGLTSGPFLGAELARLAVGKPTVLTPTDYDIASAIETS